MASDGEYLAAAGAFANAAATVTAADMGKRSRKAYYKYLREAEDRADQRSLRNWNMQNEYNSPAAQMLRYKEAGLNPNLIYGQDNTTGMPGSVEPADPGYSSDDRGVNGFQAAANAISAYQQIVGNQIANTNAAKVGRLTEEQIYAQQIRNEIEEKSANYQIETREADLNSKKFKILMDTHFEFIERKTALDEKIAEIEHKKVKTQSDLETIENLKKTRKLIEAQIDLTNSQMDSINEDVRFKRDTHDDRVLGVKLGNYQTSAQTALLGKQFQYYDQREFDQHLNNIWSGPSMWNLPGAMLKTLDRTLKGLGVNF